MPADTSAIRETLAQYALLMKEIRDRQMFLKEVMEGRVAVPKWTVPEISCLQLRMIFELIALSCLLVHGDIGRGIPKGLRKQWNPDLIFQSLQSIDAEFYPVPIELLKGKDHSEVIFSKRSIDTDLLDKKKLVSAYGKMNDVLHAGSLKTLFDGACIALGPEIQHYSNSIISLLDIHMIKLTESRVLICRMATPLDQPPSVFTLQKQG